MSAARSRDRSTGNIEAFSEMPSRAAGSRDNSPLRPAGNCPPFRDRPSPTRKQYSERLSKADLIRSSRAGIPARRPASGRSTNRSRRGTRRRISFGQFSSNTNQVIKRSERHPHADDREYQESDPLWSVLFHRVKKKSGSRVQVSPENYEPLASCAGNSAERELC